MPAETNSKRFSYPVIVLFILLLTGCSAKSNLVTLGNGQQAMKVKGMVAGIDIQAGLLTLKPGKGEEMVFTFTDSTVKMNFGSMGEIRRGKPLEVVFLHHDPASPAVSIKRLQEASCN